MSQARIHTRWDIKHVSLNNVFTQGMTVLPFKGALCENIRVLGFICGVIKRFTSTKLPKSVGVYVKLYYITVMIYYFRFNIKIEQFFNNFQFNIMLRVEE